MGRDRSKGQVVRYLKGFMAFVNQLADESAATTGRPVLRLPSPTAPTRGGDNISC